MLPLAEVDYPFLNILWSMIIFFVWVAWIWTVIMVLTDLFRRHDVGGFSKAVWTIFIIVIPFLGVLVYLITNGHGMAERNAKQIRPRRRSTRSRSARSPGPTTRPSQIATAKQLHDAGTITDAEFEQLKAKALG